MSLKSRRSSAPLRYKGSKIDAGCDDFLAKLFKVSDIMVLQHKHIGVEYVYEDDEQVAVDADFELTVEALTVIDKQTLNNLLNSILDGDTNLTRDTLDEIVRQDKVIGGALVQMAKAYQFQTISELIMRGQE